jgi:YHYH protein
MRSGFVLRYGSNGTTNLRTEGRKSLGQWAASMHTFTTAADSAGHVPLPAAAYGPNVDTYFYIGRYNEDYEYRGDMGEAQGSTYDLDQFNARFCRTPEYPEGTWAYHVTIDAAGKAVFPYTVGRQYRGQPLGATGVSRRFRSVQASVREARRLCLCAPFVLTWRTLR